MKESDIFSQGGPAFPFGTWQGMTLRDYFATKEMQAVIMKSETDEDGASEMYNELIPQLSYRIADAMLIAREAKS